MGRKYQPLSKTVKETVDLVFELTTSNPDGYDIKTDEFGFAGSLVIKILVQRGILERTRVKVPGVRYRYKWVAASAPTKVLYGSIAQEISDFYKAKNKKYPSKKKSAKKASVDAIAEEPIENNLSQFETEREKQDAVVDIEKHYLAPFTIQELWDEIKRRGGRIEGGRLAVTTYFD
jgi:hypothetical protein